MSAADHLDVRVHYWPSRTAMYWWQDFEVEAVRRDFEAAATAVLPRLAIDLTWAEFQPEPRRVSGQAMRRLEQTLDLAADAGITVTCTLFPGLPRATGSLPDWTLDLFTPAAGPPPVRNLYGDSTVVAGEERLVAEVVGEFTSHPAVDGWVLGENLSTLCPIRSPDEWVEWLAQMREAARPAQAKVLLWCGVSARTIISMPIDWRVTAELQVQLRLADDWRPDWAGCGRAEWLSFLAFYGRSVALQAVAISNIGLCTSDTPTVAPGCVEETEAASHAEQAIDGIQASGGLGTVAAALFDYDPSLRRLAPFRQNPAGLTRGLLRVDRSPKAAAAVWRAAQTLEVAVPDAPPIDPERRLREPEVVAREAYEWFTA